MAYSDYLAQRGYRRVTVERTAKAAGDVVLERGVRVDVPGVTTVTPIRRGRRA